MSNTSQSKYRRKLRTSLRVGYAALAISLLLTPGSNTTAELEALGEIRIYEADGFLSAELDRVKTIMMCFEDRPEWYGLYGADSLNQFRDRLDAIESEMKAINATVHSYQPTVSKLKFDRDVLIEAAGKHNEAKTLFIRECRGSRGLQREFELQPSRAVCESRQTTLLEEERRLRESWDSLSKRANAWNQTLHEQREKFDVLNDNRLIPLETGMKKAAERGVPWKFAEGTLFKIVNDEPIPVTPGELLEYNTRYRVPQRSRARMWIFAGVVVTYAGNADRPTEFSLDVIRDSLSERPCNLKQHLIVLTKGALRWVTAKAQEREKRLLWESGVKVKTPGTANGPRGTDYIVDVNDEGETRIVVLEGEVYSIPIGSEEETILTAGEQITVDADGTNAAISKFDRGEIARQFAVLEVPVDQPTSQPTETQTSTNTENQSRSTATKILLVGLALILLGTIGALSIGAARKYFAVRRARGG